MIGWIYWGTTFMAYWWRFLYKWELKLSFLTEIKWQSWTFSQVSGLMQDLCMKAGGLISSIKDQTKSKIEIASTQLDWQDQSLGGACRLKKNLLSSLYLGYEVQAPWWTSYPQICLLPFLLVSPTRLAYIEDQ